MRPEKRPHRSGACTVTGSLASKLTFTGGNAGSREFAGHAVHAQAVRQIRCELECEQGIVELQMFADVLPDGRRLIEDQQATMVFGQFQLAGRTQHALALDAAQLPKLDDEGLAVALCIVRRRQCGAHERARHLDAGPNVWRTADDAQRRAGADVHLADVEAVGIRMPLDRQHLTHHHTGEWRRGGSGFLDLHTGHCQQVDQRGAGDRWITELAQPGLGNLHLVDSSGDRLKRVS
jgi:hypothetical protein